MKLLPGPLLLCLSKVPKSVTTMLKKITVFVLRWFHYSVSKSYVPSIKRIIGKTWRKWSWPIWCTVATKYVSEDSRDSNGVPTVCKPLLYKLLGHISLINSYVVTFSHCLKKRSGVHSTGAAHRQPGPFSALTGWTPSEIFYLLFL